jgi:TPP-dependent pyruvate/acetoin dehydrogenase alpha subunit
MEIPKEKKLQLLRTMVTIRYFEEKVKELYLANLIRGTVHLSTGEEAVAAGSCLAIKEGDYIITTHRGHGHSIAKGVELKKLMAEILGKDTGCCRGRAGSMHVVDVSQGLMGANGIVGGGIPIATGLALGIQQLSLSRVVLCFFGEGASNQGAFHEALNLGSVWKLPVVYICENNQFGDTTPYGETMAIENIADRAIAYGMAGLVVNGNDALEVYAKVGEAVKKARSGEGPTLIECKTYRWEGHHLGDPCVYRTKAEVEEWKKKCPLKRLKNYLERENILKKAEWEKIEREAKAKVNEAEKFARESPTPDPKQVLDYVWQ